jgi:2-polyprenyl-3-methyl-5-hydroxy-6-metoxy-1,4-benzoquinol methylase
MKFIEYHNSWPESYKLSYYYDLIEAYGKVSPNMLGYSYQYKNRKKSVLDLIKYYLPNGGEILDVAAAQGNFTLELAEAGYEVTWNDLREELAGYVQLKYEKGVIHFRSGNILNFNSPHKFDVIIIAEIIEHVAHPDQFLKKISEMVKPGGYIIMSTPNGAYFLNKLPKFTAHDDPSIFESIQFKPNADGHIFLIHPGELAWFSEKINMRLHKVELYSNFLTNGHLKTGILLRVIPKFMIESIEKISNKLPGIFSKKVHSGMTVVFKKG